MWYVRPLRTCIDRDTTRDYHEPLKMKWVAWQNEWLICLLQIAFSFLGWDGLTGPLALLETAESMTYRLKHN